MRPRVLVDAQPHAGPGPTPLGCSMPARRFGFFSPEGKSIGPRFFIPESSAPPSYVTFAERRSNRHPGWPASPRASTAAGGKRRSPARPCSRRKVARLRVFRSVWIFRQPLSDPNDQVFSKLPPASGQVVATFKNDCARGMPGDGHRVIPLKCLEAQRLFYPAMLSTGRMPPRSRPPLIHILDRSNQGDARCLKKLLSRLASLWRAATPLSERVYNRPSNGTARYAFVLEAGTTELGNWCGPPEPNPQVD